MIKRIFAFTFLLLLIFSGLKSAGKDIFLSTEEIEYLRNSKILKVVSLDGLAPLSFLDEKGEVKGIAISLLEEISQATGLQFEIELYPSGKKALETDYDLFINADLSYNNENLILSKAYLEAEILMYFHRETDLLKLDELFYALVEGGTIPEGVDIDLVFAFNNREAAIGGVDSGLAHYGYGNSYSLAYYIIQNGYRNIITVPSNQRKRAYCFGLKNEDPLLLSIINKSIEAIGPNRIQTMVLDIASQVDRKITSAMIAEKYGLVILLIFILIVLLLLKTIQTNERAKENLNREIARYRILTQVSDECLFEYRLNGDKLEVSERFQEKIDFYGQKNEIVSLMKAALVKMSNIKAKKSQIIKLPLANGHEGVFKLISSNIYKEDGQLFSIVGKLMDISEESKEREKLIVKSQLDGLTNLYNAVTSRELMATCVAGKDPEVLDAFLILDCDKFKGINDNHGHLKGDFVLKNIAQALKDTYRKDDIIGRIGGDEFCVYLTDIPSEKILYEKTKDFNSLLEKLNKEIKVKVSVGGVLLQDNISYEDMFKRADDALYKAKKNGGGQIIISETKKRKHDQERK